MKRTAILICLTGILIFTAPEKTVADTIYTSEGKELKGIVIQEYRDRILFSTVDGELTLMKSDIKDIYFDSEEDNMISRAELAQDKGDIKAAYKFYESAYKINPRSKRAKDGMDYLIKVLPKEGELKKEEAVRKVEELEKGVPSVKTKPQITAGIRERLKKTYGISLREREDSLFVDQVVENSAASDAGIRSGDQIVAIWGKLIGYTPIEQAVAPLMQEAASEARITISRNIQVPIAPTRNPFSGSQELIGATLGMEYDGLMAARVSKDSGGYTSGLRANDLITDIDNNSTRYMPLKKAIEYIRSTKNTSVSLTIKRDLTIFIR
jgi:hypothetical protein